MGFDPMGMVLFLPRWPRFNLPTRKGMALSPTAHPFLTVSNLLKLFGCFARSMVEFSCRIRRNLGLVCPNGLVENHRESTNLRLYAPYGGEVALDGASIAGVASANRLVIAAHRNLPIPSRFSVTDCPHNIEVALPMDVPRAPP